MNDRNKNKKTFIEEKNYFYYYSKSLDYEL